MLLSKRLIECLAIAVAQAIFSLGIAAALGIAVALANDWDDAPGGGFLMAGMLLWALLSAAVAIAAWVVHLTSGNGSIRVLVARSSLLLFASNAIAAALVCLVTVMGRPGWAFLACLIASAGLCLWLSFAVGVTNWGFRVATAIGLPVLLLVAVGCYANIAGGESLLRVTSPDGRVLADVNRSSSGDCVLLRSGFDPIRTCVFQSSEGAIRLRWIDAKHLLVTCEDCGQMPKVIEPGQLTCSWRDVAVHYKFLGLSPLIRTSCP